MSTKRNVWVQGKDGQLVPLKVKNTWFDTGNPITKKRIKTDPCFERTRDNNALFTRAAKGAKLLRVAIGLLLNQAGDSRVTGRLTSQLYKVIKTDHVSDYGDRTIMNGDLSLLLGFQCNASASLQTVFPASFTASIDRRAGKCNIDLPAFLPTEMLIAPPAASHFKLVSLATEIDFENEAYNTTVHEWDTLPLDNRMVTGISLKHTFQSQTTLPVFLLLGVQFYKQLKGAQYYTLKYEDGNPLSIVALDIPV